MGVLRPFLIAFDRISGRNEKRYANLLLEREQTISEREAVSREREADVARMESEVARIKAFCQQEVARIEAVCQEEVTQAATLIRAREAEVARIEAVCQEEVARIGSVCQEEVAQIQGFLRRLESEQEEKAKDFDAKLDSLQRREARLLAHVSSRRPVGRAAEMGIVTAAGKAEFDSDALLRRWDELIVKFHMVTLRGSQQLIAPYILERQLYGRTYRTIIATEEGRRWYDNLQLTEAHHAQCLGLIDPGGVVLDCGCNQGINALIYSDMVGASGKVVGFDPFPLNIEISRFNATLNNKTNIVFVEAGLSEKETTVTASMLEQCVALNDHDAPDLTRVKLVPLDNYADLRPSYIKIDIEGAEIDALAGASNIIAQKPSFYIEIHPNFLPLFNRSPMEIFNYISLDDYQCFINYPDLPALSVYELEFEITKHCALFLVPREPPPVRRYYPKDC